MSDDNTGPVDRDNHRRLLRGGGWFTFGWYSRSSDRGWASPDSRFPEIGFRLALRGAGSGPAPIQKKE